MPPRRGGRSGAASNPFADDPEAGEGGPPPTTSTSGRPAPPDAPAAPAASSSSDDAAFQDVELGREACAGGAAPAPPAQPGRPPDKAPPPPPPPSPPPPPTTTTKPHPLLAPSPSGTYAECRICLEPGTPADLVAPCACTGSVRCAHLKCLQTWVEERRGLLSCEICGAPYSADVAPLLAEAAARGEARRAEAAAAAAAAQAHAQGMDGVGDGLPPPRPAGGCLGSARSRAWVAAAGVFAVALALLYVVLFVGGDHQPSFWAVLLLRILSFVLPMYLVVQACLSFRRYRQMRLAAAGL